MKGSDRMSYTWNLNEHAECWDNESFETIEECIEDAKAYMKSFMESELRPDKVFIGEVVPYTPCVYGGYVLERLEEDAYDFV